MAVEYGHSLGEIVTAAIGAGLRVDALHEHLDADRDDRGDVLARDPDGRYRLRVGGELLPVRFTLAGHARAVTVVFLHGVAGSRADLRLAAGHRGGPPRRAAGLPRPWGGAAHAGRVSDRGLLRRRRPRCSREVGPAILVGHSLGGVAAWWAAQRVPELVLGAFLEDPPLYRGEPAGHAANEAIPHFLQLRELVLAWQADAPSEREALARLAAEPDAERMTPEALDGAGLCAPAPRPGGARPGHRRIAAVRHRRGVGGRRSGRRARRGRGARVRRVRSAAADESHPGVAVSRVAGASHSIHDERAFRDAYFEQVTEFIATVAP